MAEGAAELRPTEYVRRQPLRERVFPRCLRLRRRFTITSITPVLVVEVVVVDITHRHRLLITTIITNGRYPVVVRRVFKEDLRRPPEEEEEFAVAVVVAVVAVAGNWLLTAEEDPGICMYAKRNTLALIVGVVS